MININVLKVHYAGIPGRIEKHCKFLSSLLRFYHYADKMKVVYIKQEKK
jgi:hypothetical protein